MLNEEQLQVVNHLYGPAAVLSGAGSGKTLTLISRIERLVNVTDPNKIIALTFTNAAAEEMKKRAAKANENCKNIIASTYHKYCGLMLRKYGKEIGIKPSFDILSKNKYVTFIEYIKSSSEYYENLKDFPSASKLSDIFSVITNTDIPIESLIAGTKYKDYATDILNLYNEVKQAGLEQQKLCFDDMLVYMNKLLENKDICYKIANSFEFLMVDEFQDTNDLQLRMLLMLSEYNKNIVIVGDISQSIYKFRGAKVKNIKNFIDSFDDCKTYTLTTNYRSTQEILDAANEIMNNYVMSWDYFDMKANNKNGSKPTIKHHYNDFDQAEWIINKIKQLNRSEHFDLDQIAILERKSTSSFKLENELIKNNIPFTKFGGHKFTDYAVVDDIISFLAVVVRRADKFNWFNVLRLVPGIGGKTATKIAENCTDPNFNDKYKKNKFYNDLTELLNNINLYRLDKDNLSKVLKEISEYYFALRTAKAEKAKSSSSRYDAMEKIEKDKTIISILMDMANHYDDAVKFLDDIALDSLNTEDDDMPKLVISTIHSAKGLEWPITILIDTIETKAVLSDEEEELRCLYVALTRAEEQLFISIPDCGIVNGTTIYNNIIHFIDESSKCFKLL